MELYDIHESLVNGQRRQMVNQINEYGKYDFFSDYKCFLKSMYIGTNTQFSYFADAVTSYFRITNR